MIQETPEADLFKQQLRESLLRETLNSRPIKVSENGIVYNIGQADDTIYFIDSGQIKLLMLSPQGKECMLAIYTPGDIFGELCLSGLSERLERAVAMEDSKLKKISRDSFFRRLSDDSLFKGFVQYLAVRLGDQQQVIANLVTVDSEHRLGETLLQIARKVGKKDPRSIRIELQITHEELSTMVGTTRPRISLFMQRFKNLGLIEVSAGRQLFIKEHKLAEYLSALSAT